MFSYKRVTCYSMLPFMLPHSNLTLPMDTSKCYLVTPIFGEKTNIYIIKKTHKKIKIYNLFFYKNMCVLFFIYLIFILGVTGVTEVTYTIILYIYKYLIYYK